MNPISFSLVLMWIVCFSYLIHNPLHIVEHLIIWDIGFLCAIIGGYI